MKKKNSKIVCFVLSVLLIFSSIPLSVLAVDTSSIQEPILTDESLIQSIVDPVVIDPSVEAGKIESVPIEQLKEMQPGEKTISELKTMSVDLDSLPEVIETQQALAKGHVNRLKVQETDLNTIIYQNTDGTKTTYLFSKPVKYIDQDGNIKDKSSKIFSLVNETYAYGMTNNSTKVYFPKQSSSGTLVESGYYAVSMKPISTLSSSPTYNANEELVIYNGVFGRNTAITYATTLNGVKEDIVLFKNVGVNEFEFDLSLTNLVPIQESGVWYLKNSADEIVGSLGEIIIKDSAGKTISGTMTVASSGSKGKYKVTVTAPESFLNDSNTVYPVFIDPTIYILETDSVYVEDYDTTIPYDAIIDVGLYSTQEAATAAAANNSIHRLGYVDSGAYGAIIYKFFDFYNSYGKYTSINEDQLDSVHLYFDVEAGANTTFEVYPMASTWEDMIHTSNPTTLYDTELFYAYSNAYMSYVDVDSTAGVREIDVTDIFQGWVDFNNGETSDPYKNPNNGLILINRAGGNGRNVKAVEADPDANIYNNVYVVMEWDYLGDNYYIYNKWVGQNLKCELNNIVSLGHYIPGGAGQWNIIHIENEQYFIESRFLTTDKYLCDSNGILTYSEYVTSNTLKWYIVSNDNGGSIIKNVQTGRVLSVNEDGGVVLSSELTSIHPDYNKTVWDLVLTSDYVGLTSFTVPYDEWISVESERQSVINLTPANATWTTADCFTWESSDETVATVDSGGRITAFSNGFTTITVKHKLTSMKFSFTIAVGSAIPEGTYYIMNKATGLYLDIQEPSSSEGAYIQQWKLTDATQQKWVVTYEGSGYYSIKSLYSGKYVGVSGGSNSEGADICQNATLSDAAKWKILKTPSGALKIISKSGEEYNRCLAIPDQDSGTNGTNCEQTTFAEDTSYYDEWYFSNVEYKLNIEIIMDEAYVQKHAAAGATQRILNNMWNVREVYAELYMICIEYSSPTVFTSYADTCGSEYDAHCNHGECENSGIIEETEEIILRDYHHKNITNNLYRLEKPDKTQNVLLAFSGHNICDAMYNDCQDPGNTTYGLTCPLSGYAIVCNHSTQAVNEEIKVTIHEIGHFFGVEDHYLEHVGTTSSFRDDCIHGYNKDIVTKKTVCQGCQDIVKSNAGIYGH